MKIFIFVICIFLASEFAKGAELGVQADPETFKEIFESNLRASESQIREERGRADLEFSLSSATLSDTVIDNRYYRIAYSEQASPALLMRVYGGWVMPITALFNVSPQLGFGYSYQENIVTANAQTGGVYKDVVKVQWAPVFAGIKAAYSFGTLPVGLVTRFGLTYDWVSVAGSLDGLSQSYWSPAYNLSAGLNFFEDKTGALNAWFGGVSLSYGVSRRLSSAATGFSSDNVELSFRFLL